jgi:hypothetical protein
VGRRRTHADHQPGRRAVRQSGGGRRLRRRLRGRLGGLRDPGDVLVRRLPGRPLSDEWPCSVPHGRRAHRRADGPAADGQDAPRADRLGLAWPGRPVRAVLPAGHGQDRLQDPAHLPHPEHREGSRQVLPALRPHHRHLGRRQGVPGARRGLRLHACSERGTAVSATDLPTLTAALPTLASLLALRAAGGLGRRPPAITEADIERARRAQPTVTEQDIEQARRKHRACHR